MLAGSQKTALCATRLMNAEELEDSTGSIDIQSIGDNLFSLSIF